MLWLYVPEETVDLLGHGGGKPGEHPGITACWRTPRLLIESPTSQVAQYVSVMGRGGRRGAEVGLKAVALLLDRRLRLTPLARRRET